MRALILVAALAGLAAAPLRALELDLAGGPRAQLPLASVLALRQTRTARQQADMSCGAAALATLLQFHYGQAVSEGTLLQSMLARGERARLAREGLSLLDLQQELAARGWRANAYAWPLAAVQQPAIVLLQEGGQRHFVVLKGQDGRRVLLGDPARGLRALPRAAFLAAWQPAIVFVIDGPGRGRFNAPEDWAAAPAAPLAASLPRPDLSLLPLPGLWPGQH
ncbi:C39 family peptidase [Massilia sp. TS11]|uniref:C39 family peptidase n=1 Tax=Massilia sp. TS11 TaxID=2908003 RepID=UPI001EDA48A3|nr:C39 family peptidase [Massilia sp. TS11]MCG2585741.1 C39 family peptidase [Massilia sp. TS11]